MPQMMPINWIICFIFFMGIFIIMNYFIFNYKFNFKINKFMINNNNNNNKNMIWKW